MGEFWKLLEAVGNTVRTVGFHGRLFLPLFNFLSDSQTPEDKLHFSDYTNLKVQTGNFINGIDEFDHKWVYNKRPFAHTNTSRQIEDFSTRVKDSGLTTENSPYRHVKVILALWQ